jgi:phosphotransferase system HPr (HPr) family protein
MEQNITVTNRRGVHSRVATALAMIARAHGVTLQIGHPPQLIDCGSILDVLSLALVCGATITVRVQGGAAATKQALAAVERILTTQDEG